GEGWGWLGGGGGRVEGQGWGADGADDLRHFTRAEDRVDLRNFLLQLVAIALRHAAGDDQFPAPSGLLPLRHLEDGVDRFLFRGIDERARVHDEDVRRRLVARQFVARLLGETEHHFRVDEVLGTTERD